MITVGFAVSGTSPAYAVTENADGTVTVSIEDVKAIGPANATLSKLGIRVKAVPQTSDCGSLDDLELYRGSDWDLPTTSGGAVTLGRRVPAGYTVLLSVSDAPGRGLGFTAPVKNPAPSCVLDPAADPNQR
ncbi:hypothetical protein [Cryptosporangium phraense]|uniref:hypothetical protein n=1 Tax=Cryptosporangium phraense TaxID=2593070 RepID=UPI001F106A16|nr:hypothetical protein [Cryptosporangium phraense]